MTAICRQRGARAASADILHADIVRLLNREVRVDMPFPLLGSSQNQTENSCDVAASVYVAVKIE